MQTRILANGMCVVGLVIGWIPAGPRAWGAVVVQDSFGDADRDNDGILDDPDHSGTGILDNAGDVGLHWFLQGPSGPAQTIHVSHDVAAPSGLGDDNALFVDATAIRAIQLGAIPAVHLVNPGDYVKLSFRVRFTNWPVSGGDGARDAFRFGIENDGGTPATADGTKSPTVDDDFGYFATVASSTTARSLLFANNPPTQTNSPFRITDLADELFEQGPGTPWAIRDTNPRVYVLTVTRSVANSALVKLQIDEGSGLFDAMAGEDILATGGTPRFDFNYIVFGEMTTAGTLSYILDDISVEAANEPCAAIPPATVQAPLPTGGTSVVVTNVRAETQTVNVYANGTLIGTAAGSPPATPAMVTVSVTPLAAGTTITARQVLNSVESCHPALAGVVVGDCSTVAAAITDAGLDAGATSVAVHSVSTIATTVKVYKNGTTVIGTASGNGTSNVNVTVTPLAAGDSIAATQVINGVEGCIPATGVPVRPSAVRILLSDGFGDGDRDNNGVLDNPDGSGTGVVDDANDVGAAWYKVTTANHTVKVAHDTTGPVGLGDDNCYMVDVTNQDGFAVAGLPLFTLAKPGDNVKVTMKVRFTAFGTNGQRDNFRFGLFHDSGTPISGDQLATTAVSDDDGYIGTINTGSGSSTRRIARSSDLTSGSLFSIDETVASNSAPGVNNSNAHTVALTITRSASNTSQIVLELDGTTIVSGEDTSTNGGPYFQFNEVGFGAVFVSGTAQPYLDFNVDDVQVVATVDPCPDPVFDFNDDKHVDANDFTAFVDCALGPAIPITNSAATCRCMDADRDNDVDGADFGAFQRCFAGPDILVDSKCDD